MDFCFLGSGGSLGGGILQNAGIVGGKILAQYEKDASSRLKLFELDGTALGDIDLPAILPIEGHFQRMV